MIYLWLCNRRQFVDFITDRKPLREMDVRTADSIDGITPRGDEVLLVWQRPPMDAFMLPGAVVIAEGRIPDFLAWVSTYFGHLRPFTAHCRVLTPSLAHVSANSIPSRAQRDFGSADIGLILAEGIAYSAGRTDLSRLPLSAFARTLSFAYAEGAKRFGQMFAEPGRAFDQISDGWLVTRELTKQTPLGLSRADISDVWALVLSAAGVPPTQAETQPEALLVEALKEVRETGHIPRGTWTKLCSPFQNCEPLVEAMDGPREGRVKAVDTALRELAHGPEETRRLRSFVVGYLASRVQPGSLDHFSLLSPPMANLQESLLWYGAFSGLMPETTVDNYGNSLGLLLRRELGRTSVWLDPPSCDIALPELTMLLRSHEATKPNLRTLVSGFLKVEIFPLISSSVRWADNPDGYASEGNRASVQQTRLFDEDAELRRGVFELLRKIDESSMSLAAIRQQVERTFGDNTPKGPKRRKY